MPMLRQWALIAVLTVVYFLAGKLGLHFFGLIHPSVSAVWPPTGVAIAALLLFGNRVWPAIFLGAFLVNATTAGSAVTSLGIACGNVLEALIAASLVNRFAGGRYAFERARDIFKFAVLAALLSTMVSATIGVSSLTLGGYAPSNFGTTWLTWWLGDASGAIIVTPLLLLWRRTKRLTPARQIEAALLMTSVIAVSTAVFFHPALAAYPLVFLCLPPLVWAAFRFGPREVAAAVAILSVIATWATVVGLGHFAMQTPNESLVVLQAFIAMISLTTLSMAALVTERAVLLEREQGARAEAEVANHARDEFLAVLSHELRNPLGAISVATAVLDRIGMTAEEASRWRKAIQRQTEHLTRLIEDLLDIARLTAGKMVLRRQPVDLGDAVERCVRTLTASDVVQGRRIDMQLSRVWVNADPDRLNQIIRNVISNAIKYTPAEGDIRVELSSEGNYAVIQVSDTGAGISRELLPRVFDLFAQGQQGIERTHGGLGIGLTLVRRLVELHDGSVEARSDGVKRGSTFRLRLPRIDIPTFVSASGAGTGEQSGLPYRVLVVEDNVDARQALRVLLEMAGHAVYEAADGRVAIEAALRLKPDFALVDIGLPLVDGYEVARRLRGANATTRLIAITGYGRDEDKQEAKQAGFDAHLLKPVAIERLQAVMEELLGRKVS